MGTTLHVRPLTPSPHCPRCVRPHWTASIKAPDPRTFPDLGLCPSPCPYLAPFPAPVYPASPSLALVLCPTPCLPAGTLFAPHPPALCHLYPDLPAPCRALYRAIPYLCHVLLAPPTPAPPRVHDFATRRHPFSRISRTPVPVRGDVTHPHVVSRTCHHFVLAPCAMARAPCAPPHPLGAVVVPRQLQRRVLEAPEARGGVLGPGPGEGQGLPPPAERAGAERRGMGLGAVV